MCAALHGHKDLGIHSELMTPPLAVLIKSGTVTNRYKNLNRYKNVYTLAAGDEPFYEFLNDNSSMEARPVDYVNYLNVIGQNDRVISINAFLRSALTTRSFEAIMGKQFQRPGGQLDLVRGAQLSKGGKSILAVVLDRGQRRHLAHRPKDRRTHDRSKNRYSVCRYRVWSGLPHRQIDSAKSRGADRNSSSKISRATSSRRAAIGLPVKYCAGRGGFGNSDSGAD